MIVNPSFETPVVVGSSQQFVTIPGWAKVCSTAGCRPDRFELVSSRGFPQPFPNGVQATELQANNRDATQQCFGIKPGTTYTTTFWHRARCVLVELALRCRRRGGWQLQGGSGLSVNHC